MHNKEISAKLKQEKKEKLASYNSIESVDPFLNLLNKHFDELLQNYQTQYSTRKKASLKQLVDLASPKIKQSFQNIGYQNLIASLKHFSDQKGTPSAAKKFAEDFIKFYETPHPLTSLKQLPGEFKASQEQPKITPNKESANQQLPNKTNAQNIADEIFADTTTSNNVTSETRVRGEESQQEKIQQPDVITTIQSPLEIKQAPPQQSHEVSQDKEAPVNQEHPETTQVSIANSAKNIADDIFGTSMPNNVTPQPTIQNEPSQPNEIQQQQVIKTTQKPEIEIKQAPKPSFSTETTKSTSNVHPKIQQSVKAPKEKTIDQRLDPLIKEIEKVIKDLEEGSKDLFTFRMGKKANEIKAALSKAKEMYEGKDVSAYSTEALYNDFLKVSQPGQKDLMTALNYHRLSIWSNGVSFFKGSQTTSLKNILGWVDKHKNDVIEPAHGQRKNYP